MKFNRVIHQLSIVQIKLREIMRSLDEIANAHPDAAESETLQTVKDVNHDLREAFDLAASCYDRLEEVSPTVRHTENRF